MINDYEKILLSNVRDIRGLSDISMFPLAIGWWIIIILFSAIFSWYVYRKIQLFRYKRTWKYKIYQKLEDLEDNLSDENVKETLSEITEILKRISIQIYGRREVASLQGSEWLEWLEIREPENFNWKKHGELLINYPYMQDYKITAKKKNVKELIKTVKNWLR